MNRKELSASDRFCLPTGLARKVRDVITTGKQRIETSARAAGERERETEEERANAHAFGAPDNHVHRSDIDPTDREWKKNVSSVYRRD